MSSSQMFLDGNCFGDTAISGLWESQVRHYLQFIVFFSCVDSSCMFMFFTVNVINICFACST